MGPVPDRQSSNRHRPHLFFSWAQVLILGEGISNVEQLIEKT